MKNLIMMIAVAAMVTLSACTQGTNTPTTVAGGTTDLSGLVLPVNDNSASGLVEGTLDNSMALVAPDSLGRDTTGHKEPPHGGPMHHGMGEKGDPHHGDGHFKPDSTHQPDSTMGKKHQDPNNPGFRHDPFGRVLMTLQLTPDQQAQIPVLIKAHQDCMKAAMDALRATEQPILDAARAQQKLILDQLKAGTITRQDAMTQLKALNTATRQQLEANPARIAACEQMKLCRKNLFDAIAALLTPDQLVKWQAYLASLPAEKDCNSTTTTP